MINEREERKRREKEEEKFGSTHDNLYLVSISFQTSFGVAKIMLEGTV